MLERFILSIAPSVPVEMMAPCLRSVPQGQQKEAAAGRDGQGARSGEPAEGVIKRAASRADDNGARLATPLHADGKLRILRPKAAANAVDSSTVARFRQILTRPTCLF